MELVVGTHNLHFILNSEQVETDLSRLFKQADVIGMQEMGNPERKQALERVCKQADWQFYRPNDFGSQRQTPIAWSSRWRVMQSGAQRLNNASAVEPGSGGTFVESKWAVWVVLQHGDTKIAVINWHAPGGVEVTANTKRRKVMAECTRNVRLLARTLKANVQAVFVTGDMNMNYRSQDVRRTYEFPVVQFRNEGLTPNWQYGRPVIGSHMPYDQSNSGRRLIDYVFSNAQHQRSKILTGYASDHRPVLVRYKT